MDLSVHDIIVRPRVTPKAQFLNKTTRQLVLEVHPQANKPMIARALKMLFNADVVSINIVMIPGKSRKTGKRQVFSVGKRKKKAIVVLKSGSDAEMTQWSSMPHADVLEATSKNSV